MQPLKFTIDSETNLSGQMTDVGVLKTTLFLPHAVTAQNVGTDVDPPRRTSAARVLMNYYYRPLSRESSP
jgi:hypothetical protein